MNSDQFGQVGLFKELEAVESDLGYLQGLLLQEDAAVREALHRLEGDSGDLVRLKDMLQDRRGEVDIFAELGLHNKELFHSDFIAWLLTPGGSHGIGDRFLQGFLSLFGGRPAIAAADRPATKVNREAYLDYGEETGRLDICLYNGNSSYVCAVENKVWSPEGEDQLSWYREVMWRDYPGHRVDLVFLTPDGRAPEKHEEHPHWIPIGYSQIRQLVEGILELESTIGNRDVRALLNQYAVTLRRNIVPDVSNDIDELARRIYRRHRRAIDLIVENRDRYAPNYRAEGYRMVREVVDQQPLWNTGTSNLPYVRFKSVDWEQYEELSLDAWPNFLVLFEAHATDNRVGLYLMLWPGVDDALRRRIFQRVKERGDLFNCEVRAYTDRYIVLHTAGNILEESDYEDWWDEKSIRERIGFRLDCFVRGSFPKINEVILDVLAEHRSARE